MMYQRARMKMQASQWYVEFQVSPFSLNDPQQVCTLRERCIQVLYWTPNPAMIATKASPIFQKEIYPWIRHSECSRHGGSKLGGSFVQWKRKCCGAHDLGLDVQPRYDTSAHELLPNMNVSISVWVACCMAIIFGFMNDELGFDNVGLVVEWVDGEWSVP